MHPHIHHKMRRFLTEPDQGKEERDVRYRKLALKEFKLNIGKGENLNEISIPKFNDRIAATTKNQAVPQVKRAKQRHALFKLPELLNMNDQGNDEEECTHNNPIFKRSNPLYVVNTLFQIMKEDISEKQILTHSLSNNEYPKKNASKLTTTKNSNKNQFSEFEAKSIKMQRPPRLLDNQINRLTQQSIFSRRRIYSEEKTRAKCQKDVELVTFYNCKDRSTSSWKGEANQQDFRYSQQ